MTNPHRDARGRPLVAVTGLGIVTSLGRGKQTNWEALVAGRSGIHRIERFPTHGLRTTIAGTVDYLFDRPFAAPELSEKLATIAAEEDHHPKLVTEWNRVTVSWWTHAIRGLHRNDFIMAARTDALFAAREHAHSGS